jgi:FlgD Ig-like domain
MMLRSTLVVLFIVAILTASALAEWSTDPLANNPVCTADSVQTQPAIIADGDGGSIIAWADERTGINHLYAQRLDSEGVPLWNPDGIRICEYNSRQEGLRMIEDGEGGALIVWVDGDYPFTVLYCQRLDDEGTLQWSTGGVYVSNAGTNHHNAAVATDAFSGMVITWMADNSGQDDIYIQRIRDDGSRAWTGTGLLLCDNNEDQWYPTIAPAFGGGAYVAWEDHRDGISEIYAQKVWSNGTLGWAADGLRLNTYGGECVIPKIANHLSGGFVATWVFKSTSYEDMVMYQLFNLNGESQWGYGAELTVTLDPAVDQRHPVITTDSAGKTFIVWESRTNIWDSQLYAQCISDNGDPLWGFNAVPVRIEALISGGQQVFPDGNGGCIIGWYDKRHSFDLYSLYAQRFDLLGNPLWRENGVMASPVSSYSADMMIDADGGIVFAISEFLDGIANPTEVDLFAQRVDPTGFLGRPQPAITNISDFPNDQGGEVLLDWDRVSTDDWPWYATQSYSVWARDPESAPRSAGDYLVQIEGIAAELNLTSEKVTAFYRSGWTFVTSVPAMQQPDYGCTAFTFGDSTAAGIPWMEYKVVAHSDVPWRYWESDVASGYSVDNIAPGAPIALAGESGGEEMVDLAWAASGDQDDDLAEYIIYRGASSGFPLDEAHQIGTATGLTYQDPSGIGTWFFKVTGIDVHGNEGAGSNEAMVVINSSAAGGDILAPGRTMLYAAAPNPFAQQATLSFDLAEPAEVDLGIWSVDGRRLATLASGSYTAGHHQVAWHGLDGFGRSLPQGVYFARFRAGAYTSQQRVMLIR